MSQRSVCLDFKSIFSPYVLATALASKAQGYIEKLYAPITAQFFEVWSNNLPRPVTFRLEDAAESESLIAFSRIYGFRSDNVESHDVFSALYIFCKALSHGYVELIDTSVSHMQVVKEHAGGLSFADFYNLPSPTDDIKICPDFGGATLEGMIGLSIENRFKPVFGDHEFLNYFTTVADRLKLGALVAHPLRNERFSEIIDLGAPLTADELFRYSSDQKFFSLVKRASEASFVSGSQYRDVKDVIITGISMTVDAALGVPITSVPKLAYDARRASRGKGAT